METSSQMNRLRMVLRTGALVFGVSALVLLVFPSFFNELLGFTSNADLNWAMRMIGITLVALAGNMYSVASRGNENSVLFSGRVMLFSAFSLGFLTLLIPADLNWFSISYSIIGFSFSAAYAIAMWKKN